MEIRKVKYQNILTFSIHLYDINSTTYSAYCMLMNIIQLNLTHLELKYSVINTPEPMELIFILFVVFRCGPENFTAVITEFGLCYTFNSGKMGHRVLSVHRAGVDFALKLQLNVQQDQYYGFLRDSAGFKVMVHDQDEPAMINELGFAIQPGTHTFCSLKKIVVSILHVVFTSVISFSTLYIPL